ncbi:CTR1-like protein kinase [Artemisia annua]|uniref:CTR1-like protein kinase n=1 Tax=Artemisia annua TaxID=35608 RepID=A0A2U1MN89_ARTAN|nr:CTR1-like protein kinase [Artemisia annua]
MDGTRSLCDEPSNEKSDLHTFVFILWKLATLQQPWGNLNPAHTRVFSFGYCSSINPKRWAIQLVRFTSSRVNITLLKQV